MIPIKNEYLEMYRKENPENKVIKVDSALNIQEHSQKGAVYMYGAKIIKDN